MGPIEYYTPKPSNGIPHEPLMDLCTMYMYRLLPNLSTVHSIGCGGMAPLTTCNTHALFYSYLKSVVIIISSLSLSRCTCVLMCTSGVAVTPCNVLRAVREVERWWGEEGLRDWLCIPKSKEEEIRQNFPDEMDQKKHSVTYWINTDPLVSWRRLIRALDKMREAKVADSIRSNAEPLTGNPTFMYYSLTVE